MHKNTYYFALSAAASAAVVASPQVAKAVCDCTVAGLVPQIIRSQGADAFIYNGSPSAGYDAILQQDNVWGFNGSTAPSVYFDYWLSETGGSWTTSAQICRTSYLGSQINCGLTKTQTVSPSGYTPKEMGPISVANTYGPPSATLSVWDLVRMHVIAPSSNFGPRTIPAVSPACW